MKQVKLSFLLCLITIVTFAQTAQRGEQNPPMPGIGVVVKRNPGGGASKAVVTNENGQANITIKEAGNYTIALTQTQGKTAGEPIPGTIVKCGKNPGGKMMTVTTNEKGEADLNDLEKGDYTFTVEQPVTEHRGHVTLIKKNEGKPNTNMTISDDNTSTDYVGHVTLLRFSQLYLGGGLIMPSSTTKEGANSINGIDFNIGYYQPIWAWEKSMISLGINAEFGYNIGNGERDTKNQYTVYNLAGQSQLPTISERGGKGHGPGFRGAAGLQMNVHLGDKFTLSPIINAGYLSTTLKSFSVEETIYPQGNEFTYTLLAQKESKTSGLGILPKLRMTYNITPRIGIWLEGNYTIGPKIKTEVTTFAPEPSAGVDGTYTLSQFENGAYTTTKRETSYSAVGVNGGVVFDFWYARSSERLRHKNKIESSSTTEFSGSESIYDCVHCGEKISNAKEAVAHQKVCPKKSNSDTTSTSTTLGYQVIDKCKKLVPMCKKDSKDVDCGECSAKVNIICAIKEITYDCNTSTTTTKSKSVRFESNNTNVKAYSIEDNEKSNDAKLANSDAIKSYVSSLISEGYRYDYAIVNKIYNKYTLIYNFKNKDSDTELIIIPLVLEKEYLKLGEKVIIQNAKGETIKKITDISSQKHNYVGHVTLLR